MLLLFLHTGDKYPRPRFFQFARKNTQLDFPFLPSDGVPGHVMKRQPRGPAAQNNGTLLTHSWCSRGTFLAPPGFHGESIFVHPGSGATKSAVARTSAEVQSLAELV